MQKALDAFQKTYDFKSKGKPLNMTLWKFKISYRLTSSKKTLRMVLEKKMLQATLQKPSFRLFLHCSATNNCTFQNGPEKYIIVSSQTHLLHKIVWWTITLSKTAKFSRIKIIMQMQQTTDVAPIPQPLKKTTSHLLLYITENCIRYVSRPAECIRVLAFNTNTVFSFSYISNS